MQRIRPAGWVAIAHTSAVLIAFIATVASADQEFDGLNNLPLLLLSLPWGILPGMLAAALTRDPVWNAVALLPPCAVNVWLVHFIFSRSSDGSGASGVPKRSGSTN